MLLSKKWDFINKFLKLLIIICLLFINKSLILKILLFDKPLISTKSPFQNNFRFLHKIFGFIFPTFSQSNTTFLSKDRGYNRILVIDIMVPNIDKHAGYRCTYMYLNLFKEIGLQVTFLPDNLKKMEPYTTILQQKGIEVLYGDWYKKTINNWLKNNLKYFKFVYLQRPYITKKYYDLIRQYFSGKIFYFAHDLHYIRLLRQYNITHNKEILKESKISEKIEMEIFSKADVIHVVGNYEYQILKDKFNKKIIRNIPIYIYDKLLSNVEKDFSKRKDLIFVGGFGHSPNKDAVLWFEKYVYPKIVKRFQDMIWHIVGSNIPGNIKKLESKNIKVEGFLSDEDLHSLYQKCRIAIWSRSER